MDDKNNNLEQCLKRFLLDIDCIRDLEYRIQGFNPFDVLKINRKEIRHSNVLAWLLDPNESHGYSHKILEQLNHYIVKDNILDSDDSFKLLTMNYSARTCSSAKHLYPISTYAFEFGFALFNVLLDDLTSPNIVASR